MKTLTPAESARRAAVLGITLPAPDKPDPPSRSNGPTAHKAGKLAANPPVPTDAAFQRFKQVQKLLAARYPQIFSWGRPLAIGIDLKLREAFSEEELRTGDLKAFLRIWVHRHAYRAALERGERRVNLNGSDAGPAFDRTETQPTAEATEGGDQDLG